MKNKDMDFVNKAAERMGIKVTDELLSGLRNIISSDFTLEEMAKGITYFCWRDDSFLEGMHGAGKISDKEMKKLNQMFCDKIFKILFYIYHNESMKLKVLLDMNVTGAKDWDDPKIDAV